MSWSVPQPIEDALWHATTARVAARVLAQPALIAAVKDRSRRYTSDRDDLSKPSDADGDLAARALFFAVADVAKVGVPLAELAATGTLADGPLTVTDAGAGAGAMSLGVVAMFAARAWRGPIRFTLLDRDARALAIAVDAITRAGQALQVDVHVTTSSEDVRRMKFQPCDLFIAGTLLNELTDSEARHVTTSAMAAARLATILIEPALRVTSRALHALRDELIVTAGAVVLAPCTHAVTPCPMLADERDWCHEHRPLELPPRAAKLAEATGLRDSGMKFSYLMLAGREQAANPARTGALRVVSETLKPKGKQEFWVCGPDGRRKLRMLDRHRTDAAKTFRATTRGDELCITPKPDERGDVAADAVVARTTYVSAKNF